MHPHAAVTSLVWLLHCINLESCTHMPVTPLVWLRLCINGDTVTSRNAQASGTATFVDDIPIEAGSLYGAYVCARFCKGKVTAISTADALKVPGAVRFVGPEDVPGHNLRCARILSAQGSAVYWAGGRAGTQDGACGESLLVRDLWINGRGVASLWGLTMCRDTT
eukprot:1152708-Pelagomonas_calceolata.AAC.7